MRFAGSAWYRLAAVALAVAISGTPLVFSQANAVGGSLTGRIFKADGVTPRTGVLVKVAHLSTSEVFTSPQTDKAGRYDLGDLPSGQYQVVVETGEGLYVNQDKVPVMQGRKTLFSLALSSKADDENPPEGTEGEAPAGEETTEEDDDDEGAGMTPAEEEASESKSKFADFFRSGWGVATALGGGAVILGLLADSIAGDSTKIKGIPSPSSAN